MSEPEKHEIDRTPSGPPRARLRYLSKCLTGGLSGWSLWHYVSDFSLAEVCAPVFFEDATDMLHAGDFLAVSTNDGGALLYIDSVHEHAVTTKPMATALTGDAADTAPTMHAFLSLYRRLRRMDREDVKFLGTRDWESFRDGPVRFLIDADDATATRVWRVALGVA